MLFYCVVGPETDFLLFGSGSRFQTKVLNDWNCKITEHWQKFYFLYANMLHISPPALKREHKDVKKIFY